MNYEDVKAKFLWYLTHDDQVVASEIYHDDALVEFPQSGEKFRGKENFIPWRSEYPAATIEFEVRAIRGEGDSTGPKRRLTYPQTVVKRSVTRGDSSALTAARALAASIDNPALSTILDEPVTA